MLKIIREKNWIGLIARVQAGYENIVETVKFFEPSTGKIRAYEIVGDYIPKTIQTERLLSEKTPVKRTKETIFMTDYLHSYAIVERTEYYVFRNAQEARLAAIQIGCELDGGEEEVYDTLEWYLDTLKQEPNPINTETKE